MMRVAARMATSAALTRTRQELRPARRTVLAVTCVTATAQRFKQQRLGWSGPLVPGPDRSERNVFQVALPLPCPVSFSLPVSTLCGARAACVRLA